MKSFRYARATRKALVFFSSFIFVVALGILVMPSAKPEKITNAAIKTIFDISTMQEMTAQICANTTTPTPEARETITTKSKDTGLVPTTTLLDTRDGKSYRISKLADGNCWMTQNLDLGDNSTAENPLVLTPDDTDITENFTMPAVQTTEDVWWFNGGTTETPPSGSTVDTDVPHFHDYSRDPNISLLFADFPILLSESEQYGNLYNLYLATAGTAQPADTLDEVREDPYAPSSICPRGWQLPIISTELDPDTSPDKSFAHLFLDVYNLQESRPDYVSLAQYLGSPFYIQLAGLYEVRTPGYYGIPKTHPGLDGYYRTAMRPYGVKSGADGGPYNGGWDGSFAIYTFNNHYYNEDVKPELGHVAATLRTLLVSQSSDGHSIRCVSRGTAESEVEPEPEPEPEPTPDTPEEPKKEEVPPTINPQTLDRKVLPLVVMAISALTLVISLASLKLTRR